VARGAPPQAPLLVGAAGRTVDSIGQWVRTLIAQNCEHDLELEQDTARAQRRFRARVWADGTVRGSFVLAAEDGEPVLTAIEALSAPQGRDDTRTAVQRRADALVELAAAGLRWADLPHAGGQRAQLFYVMSAEWAARRQGAEPPVAAWSGPQTRAHLEALCCDARISRVLLDRTGQVRGLQSVSGSITRTQRQAVSARDKHCVARGCTRPPAYCDVHHLHAREDGGRTDVANLVLLCRRHHTAWHRGEVQLPELRTPWMQRPDEPRAGPVAA